MVEPAPQAARTHGSRGGAKHAGEGGEMCKRESGETARGQITWDLCGPKRMRGVGFTLNMSE